MMKRLFWLLLTVNLVFFAFMQWGEILTGENNNLPNQLALNEEKIKLLTAPPEVHASPPFSPEVHAPAPLLPELHAETPLPSVVPVVSQVQPAGVAACLEWGEFSGNDLKRAISALAMLNLGGQLSRRQVEYISGYWAYIPPPKTRAEIDRKISVLKARGVVDYFIVQEPGRWHNAISLGVFKTKESAKKFVDKLAAQGIKTPVVGERKSKLKFTVFVLKNPEAAVIEKVTELHREFDGSELRSAVCN